MLQTTTFIVMPIRQSDLVVLKQAIAQEQMPAWSTTHKSILAADAGVFVAAAIGHYLQWRAAGVLVTFAVVGVLFILAVAPKPRQRDRAFYERPVSEASIAVLLSSLSTDVIQALKRMSADDSESLLRVRHLRELVSSEVAPAEQQVAWRSEV
ncbi:hypothetical protein PWP93_36290 [Paraburkholderia sp. A1RI-2L]|uniref:hypothetical protein n=1 Tax=Paraburkholderia sp. A1RI-2L TaxID=3028367 RepID=UPI003B7690CA